jgi:hypothetical protein
VSTTRADAGPEREAPARARGGTARWVRDHSLSIATLGLFLVIWMVGMAWSGHRAFNDDQRDHGEPTVSFGAYLRRADFAEATFENWESEFLQMGVYVLLTAWLVQKGSGESKPLYGFGGDDNGEDGDPPWPVRRGGAARWLHEHSLSIVLLGLFALAFLGHLVAGAHAFNADQAAHHQPGVTVWRFLFRSEFWFQSFQNWQSEFLVGVLVVLSIYLRQRGSPESKPVDAPNAATGDEQD